MSLPILPEEGVGRAETECAEKTVVPGDRRCPAAAGFDSKRPAEDREQRLPVLLTLPDIFPLTEQNIVRKAFVDLQSLKNRPPIASIFLPYAKQIRCMDSIRTPHLFRKMLRTQKCEKPLPILRIYLRPGEVCSIL